MRWRLLEAPEPFTFFVNLRPGARCDPHTFDVCVWVPGGRLDVAPTVAHLAVGFLLELAAVAFARRRPGVAALRRLVWAGVPALALLKEVFDGFTPTLVGPFPVGGSGFSAVDLGFTLLGQLLFLGVTYAVAAPPAGGASGEG